MIIDVPIDKRSRTCQRHHKQAAGSRHAAVTTAADLQQASAAFCKATAQMQQQHQQWKLGCSPAHFHRDNAVSSNVARQKDHSQSDTQTQSNHKHCLRVFTVDYHDVSWRGLSLGILAASCLKATRCCHGKQAQADCIAMTVLSAAISVPATAGDPTATEQSQYIKNTASALSTSISQRPH